MQRLGLFYRLIFEIADFGPIGAPSLVSLLPTFRRSRKSRVSSYGIASLEALKGRGKAKSLNPDGFYSLFGSPSVRILRFFPKYAYFVVNMCILGSAVENTHIYDENAPCSSVIKKESRCS